MSIVVHLKRFKTLNQKYSKYARVEFRNSPQFTMVRKEVGEYLMVNEVFIWNLDTPLRAGETLVVYLIDRKLCNMEQVIGVFRLGMQLLTVHQSLEVTDVMIDDDTNHHSCTETEKSKEDHLHGKYQTKEDSPELMDNTETEKKSKEYQRSKEYQTKEVSSELKDLMDHVYVEMSVYCTPDRVEPEVAGGSASLSPNATLLPEQIQSAYIKKIVLHLMHDPKFSHLPALVINQPVQNTLAASRKAYASRKALTDPAPSTSKPELISQKSPTIGRDLPLRPSIIPPESRRVSSYSSLVHTLPKTRANQLSSNTPPSTSRNGSAPQPTPSTSHPLQKEISHPVDSIHASIVSQPLVTSKISDYQSRQGLTSLKVGLCSIEMSLFRQRSPSPNEEVILSPPRDDMQHKSPYAFHQALMTKCKIENERKQIGKLSSLQSSLPGSGRSSQSSVIQSDGDESDPLLKVERNIATLERSLMNKTKDVVIDIESEDTIPITRESKLKQVGKRLFSRNPTFGDRPSKNALENEQKSKKITAFRSVKNLMRFGRSKMNSSGDEELELLEIAAGGVAADEANTSQPAVSSDEGARMDVRFQSDTPKITPKKMCNVLEGGPDALKAADFQVCITVIEARQLAGLNMDPFVGVQVGDTKKYTSVQESTNCPYYNEYFVFDFHMSPVMLLDKIITLSVYRSRELFRTKKLLGNFKLDVATVWNQPDRQFYHKWAVLTDPEDFASGSKGYLKCDICVIGKGDQIKVPPINDKDKDDVEGNLLLPDGVPLERQYARFVVTIHKADGLPKMNYSLVANVKKAFTGESRDLVDPYVQVSFAGMTGQTSVRKNTYSPVWNEEITFTEMFPPLCQRIKIQLKDDHSINHQNSNVIGTHFMDLSKISHDGEHGFLPTFGPAYVYLYGSTRGYSLIDQYSNLNDGMSEGVSYRGRILMSIRTTILDILELPQSKEVEVDICPPITETTFIRNEDFFLFASIYEASMIDKKLTDKALSFELSIGNSGNSLDGSDEAMIEPKDYFIDNKDELKVGTGFWQSTTTPSKAVSFNKVYYNLQIWERKECVQVRFIWPDHRLRMYNSNLIASIVDMFEEGLADAETAMERDDHGVSIHTMKAILEAVSNACACYVHHMKNLSQLGSTRLDRERLKLCLHDIGQLSVQAKNLKLMVAKHSLKERLRTAHAYLKRLRHLQEDPQHSMPDVFLWLVSNGKRLAYHRVPAREIMYSNIPYEMGKYCAKMQTIFMKWPGKKASSSNWKIPAQASVYFWLGAAKHKARYGDGLPPGFEVTDEIVNAAAVQGPGPTTIIYNERHIFQMRAYIYQARSLIGSDASGLSDPFARIVIGDFCQTTQVIDQTLSPTWDETLVFENVMIYSTMETIKADPPVIVIEIFDQDSVGKSEFIGRTIVKPFIKSLEDVQNMPCLPALEWHGIRRGDDNAGELLATFELLEMPGTNKKMDLPDLPSPRQSVGKAPQDIFNKGPILPVPLGIRPTLSKYRIEVLFWGLRDLKRVHFLSVSKPRVDIECSGHILTSSIIQNAKLNPNFSHPTQFIELELPEQDLYQPPLTIRVVDCRSFGRTVLVGTHTINSIQKYIFSPMTKQQRVSEDRKRSLIQLENVDLHDNCIIQGDVFTIAHERDRMPVVPWTRNMSHMPNRGSDKRSFSSFDRRSRTERNRKASGDSVASEDEVSSKDWWTRYFASYEAMKEKAKGPSTSQAASTSAGTSPKMSLEISEPLSKSGRECSGGARRKEPTSPKKGKRRTSRVEASSKAPPKKQQIPKCANTMVYPHELEAVPEYEEFKEWLHTFDLYRGKKTGDDQDDESRVVGSFKGAVKVYKWPLPKDIDDSTVMGHDPNHGFFQGFPSNEPIPVLVRIYIVKATDLHPMDINGKADPYIVLTLGNKKISDQANYVSKQLNPVFGKCYEIEATFPQDSILSVTVYDWDLLRQDEVIGETKIDLENRFYSRHRGTCGLPEKYEETGYNRWRDSLKPTQILAKLCKENKLEQPIYEYTRVTIGRTVFNMPFDEPELFSNPDVVEEQMALVVLRRWHDMPRVGCHLMREHVETRPLYKASKPGIEQGRLEMWIDLFPGDVPAPGPPIDISPRKPKSYELRVIIWNTEDVVLEDDAFFTGEKMSDIYVKGWLKGTDHDLQSTDVHYRSLTGEGNFNWRFVYPFEYLVAEERIVTSRKETLFSWDQTESKIPPRLELQVWDADHFISDDFLGALTLDLTRFPRGAKTAKKCTLAMMVDDGNVPTVNIFKQKRVRGWWPFCIKRDIGKNGEELELTGKVEAEIHLLSRDEADAQPVGLGRNEPEALEKPSRPDTSFMWILNPIWTIRYVLWHNHKRAVFKWAIVFLVVFMWALILIAIPGYLVKKLMGA